MARKAGCTLLKLLDESDPQTVSRVVSALGDLAVPTAVDSLIRHLESSNVAVRTGVVSALTRIGDPLAVPALITALSDSTYIPHENSDYFAFRQALKFRS